MNPFKPEGALMETEENKRVFHSLSSIQDAFQNQRILEARAIVCDSAHNLIVDLGCIRGMIPREEGALGIADGSVKDIAIISRVNKPVCFFITGFEKTASGETRAILSRRKVQELCTQEYISKLTPGDILAARVTHMESFGCFVDIACGIPSLIPIDAISISRISHPSDRFSVGQEIYGLVKSIEEGRITLTHKELLGTWEENAALFENGETVAGTIRSVEGYGVFVELTPNLAGLAEPKEGVKPGQQASVYIKNLIPEKMKVKLIIVDAFDAVYQSPPLHYFLTNGHLDRWRYSPECSSKTVETVFSLEDTGSNPSSSDWRS